IGTLRRIRCTNWPMPIAPVSPSPLTPIAISLRLASIAPVPTEGIRPWTELNPCDAPRKYAGLLLEQPIPDSLITCRGSIPRSKNASIMRSEIALWPHPAQSVVLPPRYGCISSPIRFVFFGGVGSAVSISPLFYPGRAVSPALLSADAAGRHERAVDRTVRHHAFVGQNFVRA